MTVRAMGAILVGAALCSVSAGQVAGLETDWTRGLTESIGALNRNIQRNVQQLNQRIQQTVRSNVAEVERMAEKLKEDAASGKLQTFGGNGIFVSNVDGGAKFVLSGQTSDGEPYVREIIEKLEGDVLRHISNTYYPKANASVVYGYALNLKDPDAKPVPINDTVA